MAFTKQGHANQQNPDSLATALFSNPMHQPAHGLLAKGDKKVIWFFSSPSNFSTLIAIKVSKYGPARTIYVRRTGETCERMNFTIISDV